MSTDPSFEQFGPYQLTHLLGKGGMAAVYRAVLTGPMGFEKEVAIKRIHESLAGNEDILRGLINEARIGGQLKHPNIVEVYEFNKVDEAAYYLALEFVDGWTLDRMTKFAARQEMPIPPAVVLDIARQVCDGLDYAHKLTTLDGTSVKLIHRDLKPANIIVSRYGIAKLLDFGIAKAATNLFHTTVADVTKGTPHYMSPEQVQGNKNLTAASDLFAFGALLYELATGNVLFAGDALGTVLFSVVKAEVGPQIAEADRAVPGIAPLLEQLLAKDPAHRLVDAAAVSDALKQLLEERHSDGPTVRDYLYSVRGRMLGKSGRDVSGRGQPIKSNKASVDAGGDPQFATLMAGELVPEGENLALAEARAAADAEIGAGLVFGETGAKPVDAGLETLDGVFAPDEDETAQLPFVDEPEPPTPIHTDPNQKPTRQVAGPTRRMARKASKTGWSVPLLLIAASLGFVLLGTVGWIVKMALETDSGPVVVENDSTDALPDLPDLSLSDLSADAPTPGERPTAAVEPKTAAPDVVASVDSTPAEAETPALAETPTPEVEVAIEATPEPTPARVAVVQAKGLGSLSIKKSNPYARIIIDGIDTGKTTPLMRLPVPAGAHVVVLVAVEMQKRSQPRSFTVVDEENLKLGHYDFHSDDWSD